ncbi:MAG: acetylxylan esterase [Friedmanniella sp.]
MAMFDLPFAELESFRPEVAEPEDFDAFWSATLEETRGFDLAASSVPVDNKLTLIDTYDITYAGFGGAPVRAWLHVPAGSTGPLPTVVQYNGYSRGRGFPHSSTLWAQAGYAHLVMDTRGQGWRAGGSSETADASIDAGANHAPGFMTAGILDPATYYYRRVYTDAVRLLEVTQHHPLLDAGRVVVTGGSQGGGLAIAAAGLAPLAGLELLGAAPDVPFLCHFARAVSLVDTHPYGEIAEYLAGWRQHVETAFTTLSYFDGVNLGRRAQCPALFSVGLMDTICPPSTVFAAFNHYAHADKQIEVYPFNNHEGGEDHQAARQLDWFAERFSATV